MNEVFAEYIVKRKLTFKSVLARAAVVLLVVASLLTIGPLGSIGITITFLAGYFAYYVFGLTSVEYEYSIVNTDIIVDKIMGQRKRKRMAEYDLKKAEMMAYISSGRLEHYKDRVVVNDYSSLIKSDAMVGIVFSDVKGQVELIFEPNERILDAIKKVRPNLMAQ